MMKARKYESTDFAKGDTFVLIGYDGDGLARDVLVDAVHDNRITVWDRNRKVYRTYLFKLMGRVVRTK